MVFGLGKKNEEQAPAPTQQMSAEAMTMLSQMAQQGGNAQAAPDGTEPAATRRGPSGHGCYASWHSGTGWQY
jgi:hypothetical protein